MRLPKNRLARVTLYVFSFGVIAVALDLLLITIYARVHPGPDTTVLTAPLLPDGRIDYLAALDAPFAAGVTRDNNVFVPFLETLGLESLTQSLRTPFAIALGIDPGKTPDNSALFDFEQFAKSRLKPDEVTPDTDPLIARPWRAADQPLVADWLQRAGPALDRLRDASRRPRYYYPFTAAPRTDVLLEVILPDLNHVRAVINAFLARAMLRASSGDLPAATEDLLAAHRIAALWNQSPIGVARAVANYADAAVSKADRALLPLLPAEQLAAFARMLDALPPLPPVAPVADHADRYICLDTLQYVARLNPVRAFNAMSSFAFPPTHANDRYLAVRSCLPIDYDAHMRAANAFVDQLVAALNEPTYPARRAAVERWKASHDALPSLLKTEAFFPTSRFEWLLKPSVGLDVANAQRGLTRVAAALAAHKLSTGHYPASLADLPNLPTDLYTLKPFPYHPTPDGYALTSAGPNMTDDTGKADDLDASVPLHPPASH